MVIEQRPPRMATGMLDRRARDNRLPARAGRRRSRPPLRRGPATWPAWAAAGPPGAGTVEALRFTVTGPIGLPATRGIVLADLVHRAVVREFDGGRPAVVGHAGARSGHTHAHWVPLPTGDTVTSMLVWVTAGLSTAEVAGVLAAVLQGVSTETHRGHRRYDRDDEPRTRLDLHSAGPAVTVAPELCGPAKVWRSLTPYLPVRHRKRTDLADYLSEDIRHELAYRDRPPTAVRRLGPTGSEVDPWASAFRRHRLKEGLERHRPGYGLRLVFDAPVSGPLLLGQLSHFGFGIFVPEGGDS